METFASGDRVLAINTDISGPILAPSNLHLQSFGVHEGPVRSDRFYHFAAIQQLVDGSQRILLAGLRVLHGSKEIPWRHSLFR